jgi:hypothetical protein
VGRGILDGPSKRDTKILRDLNSAKPEERGRVSYEEIYGFFPALIKLSQDLTEVLIGLETIHVFPEVIEGGLSVMFLHHGIPPLRRYECIACRRVDARSSEAARMVQHVLASPGGG